MPGYGGVFCQQCLPGTYSPDYSKDECLPCPCNLLKDGVQPSGGSRSAEDCKCAADDSNTVGLIEVFLILIGFNLILFVTYYIFYKNTVAKDDKYD